MLAIGYENDGYCICIQRESIPNGHPSELHQQQSTSATSSSPSFTLNNIIMMKKSFLLLLMKTILNYFISIAKLWLHLERASAPACL